MSESTGAGLAVDERNEAIRSQKPDRVPEMTLSGLLAANLVRLKIARVAQQIDVPPRASASSCRCR
jgi:hypothetical protein